MLPEAADFLESGDDVGGEAAGSVGRGVADEVAEAVVLRDQPLLDDLGGGFERPAFIPLLPEPSVGERDAGLGGQKAFLR